MRRLAHWLRQEPMLKLVSFLIALLVWAWRSSEANPEEERKFADLTVRWENLARDLTVVTEAPTVDILVRGPRRTLDRLQAENRVQPTVDLKEITQPAWQAIAVSVDVPDNVTVKSIAPDQVEVEIDQYETDIKPVRADFRDTAPPEGYLYQPPQLSTETAQVRGPRKLVSRVAYVAAEVDLNQRVADFSGLARLRPMDSSGQELKGIETYPREVNVSVAIDRIEERRMMKVVAPLVNEPPAGYAARQVTVEPREVLVQGSAGGLANLGEALTTVPIDLTDAKATFSKRVSLVLTPGVVAEPDKVTVKVVISRIN